MKTFTKFFIVLFFVAIASSVTASITTDLPDNWEKIKKAINIKNPIDVSGDKIVKTLTEKDGFVVLEVLYMQWENGDWVNEMKMENTYDNNEFLIEIIIYIWVENTWVKAMKMEYTNSASGQPMESFWYLWNSQTEEWDLIGKDTYTYDGNGNLIELLSQTWLEEQWVNSHKLLFTYDGNGYMIELLELDWDFLNQVWENFDIHYYTYDNNLLMEELKQLWWQGAWENEYNTFWTYDGGGNATERLKLSWEGGAWENFLHNTYTYNADWQEIEDFVEEWENGAWVNHEIHYKTYDANGNMIEQLTQVWEAKGWVNEGKQIYSYGFVDISEYSLLNNSDFNLINYPNPFTSSTTISFDIYENCHVQVEIFDITGKSVKTLIDIDLMPDNYTYIWNGTNNNGNEVEGGIYFYRLSTDKYTETKRMTFVK
ncbi:MAG: T9SS type A sorting domain-containing protein [Bacteroidales bacterium]|nr:T9SS type A sorting domain-containing protein [Bacteroidales bacterium]